MEAVEEEKEVEEEGEGEKIAILDQMVMIIILVQMLVQMLHHYLKRQSIGKLNTAFSVHLAKDC